MNIKQKSFSLIIKRGLILLLVIVQSAYANKTPVTSGSLSGIYTDNELIIHEEKHEAGDFSLKINGDTLKVKKSSNKLQTNTLILSGALNHTTTIKNEATIKNIVKGYYSISIVDQEGNISHKLFQIQ